MIGYGENNPEPVHGAKGYSIFLNLTRGYTPNKNNKQPEITHLLFFPQNYDTMAGLLCFFPFQVFLYCPHEQRAGDVSPLIHNPGRFPF